MPIQYRLKNDNGHASRQTEKLQNISSGGLSFYTDRKIEPGKTLDIEIEVKPPPFTAEGIVVWCNKEANGYQVGLRFNDANVEFSLRMIEQLCYIEQYKKDILIREGRTLTSEQAAEEWISQFAGEFPR